MQTRGTGGNTRYLVPLLLLEVVAVRQRHPWSKMVDQAVVAGVDIKLLAALEIHHQLLQVPRK
jgi:hypothetical protein